MGDGTPLEHLGAALRLRHPPPDPFPRSAGIERRTAPLTYEPPAPVASFWPVLTCEYCRRQHHRPPTTTRDTSCPGCGAPLPLEAS